MAIVSSDIVARQLDRKATGYVDGYVVENYRAGGHNAPPRRDRNLEDNGMTTFNQKDEPNLEKIRSLGKPFWLAGKFSTPEAFKSALAEGATGVQIGTPFAFCKESGMREDIRHRVLKESVEGTISIETSFKASPTGYPFKLVHLKGSPFAVEKLETRKRVCDMGYLRTLYRTDEGGLKWRCPAEPIDKYVEKQGDAKSCEGRLCLCNGLAASAGYGQARKQGTEPVVVTSGDDVINVKRFVKGDTLDYSAEDVINQILS